MIIEKKSLLTTQLQVIIFVILLAVLFKTIYSFELSWYLNGLLIWLGILIILSLIDISNTTKLENGIIKKGIYIAFLGFLKIKKQILVKNITDVKLHQNENLYFEIRAKTSTEELILKKFPNKNTAEKELSNLALSIKNAC